MPVYSYEAIDVRGQTVSGVVESGSEQAAGERLRQTGHYVIALTPRAERAPQRRAAPPFLRRRSRLKDVMVFTRQFSVMINAGLSIVRCLEILEDQTKDPRLRAALQQGREDVSGGMSLADALARSPAVFSDLYVSMLRAAEAGGILDSILSRLATYLEKEVELRERIKSALTYPAIILIFSMAMVGVLVFWILPKFSAIFAAMHVSLPLTTKILVGTSHLAVRFWYVPPILALGVLLALWAIVRTERGRYRMDWVKLHLPALGEIVSKIAISRFSRTLGTLAAGGVPLMRCLDVVSHTAGNLVIVLAVQEAQARIREGERITAPLAATGVFPTMVTQMISVGEETGELPTMLSKISDFYDEEVDNTLKSLTSLIEPALIIGLGFLVGLIAVSVITPIYSLIGSVH